MSRLRVLFFGTTGPLSMASLGALAADHRIVGVVCAGRGARSGLRGWAKRAAVALGVRPLDPAARAARECGAAFAHIRSRAELAAVIERYRRTADLVCVAVFPWKIPNAVIEDAPLGGINLHTSLLPRHRGPLTLFWVYHANDRQTGVTVHRVTETFDGGDILAQHAFRLDRGYSVDRLNMRYVDVGPALLRQCALGLSNGDVIGTAQDESLATYAPFVRPGARMVDFAAWDTERVWHFLAGLFPRFAEPIVDTSNHPISYSGVIGYRSEDATMPIGTARRIDDERLSLQCRNGVVYLKARR